MVISEQASTAGAMAPAYKQYFASPGLSSVKPVDLSCHENDVCMESVPQNIDLTMDDSQGKLNSCNIRLL